jgi:hypothetical protein
MTGIVTGCLRWPGVLPIAAYENLICMAAARRGDFDLAALYTAPDEQRRARGLTWAGVTREINRPDARPVLHPVSVSSVTGTSRGRGGEGNNVLLMLLWLNRTPESFVPGHPAPAAPGTLLPRPSADRHLRWDVPALHAALDAQRQEQGTLG